MGDAEMGLLRVAFSRCLAAFFSWGLRFRAAEMKTQGGAGDDGLKLEGNVGAVDIVQGPRAGMGLPSFSTKRIIADVFFIGWLISV